MPRLGNFAILSSLTPADQAYYKNYINNVIQIHPQDKRDPVLILIKDYQKTNQTLANVTSERTRLSGQLSQKNHEFDQLQYQHGLLQSKAENDTAELKNKLRQTIERYEQQLKHQHESLETRHTKEIEGLKAEHAEQVSTLNSWIFAREKFAAIPDRKLSERFSDLCTDVRNLSRQMWRDDSGVWSRSALEGISGNPARLREQLLQNDIWWLLHEYIFASPFRMFGDEGRSLEKNWAAAFGEDVEFKPGDYTWPRTALQTERWRYETIKQCQTALKEPASELDPRARIKHGFISSRDSLSTSLKNAINSVASKNANTSAEIDRLIKKAVSMWIDFGLQRCRLMTTMPSSRTGHGDVVSARLDVLIMMEKGPLELTNMPGLIRYGDESGQDLQYKQTVGNCNAMGVKVP